MRATHWVKKLFLVETRVGGNRTNLSIANLDWAIKTLLFDPPRSPTCGQTHKRFSKSSAESIHLLFK